MTPREAVESSPLPMLQHREEIIPFLEWAVSQDIKHVLEIGTGPGGLTWAWSQLVNQVVTVDIAVNQPIADWLATMSSPNIFSVCGDSRLPVVKMTVKAMCPEFDLLFIDGDHAYEGVSSDYEHYAPLVKSGGWIAFHDINASRTWPSMGVLEFWLSLQGEKKEWVCSPYSDHPPTWGGIGAVKKA